MMLHGAWTYGSMKADGGDFVTGGNLGYMNFPPVDGGKGDPSDTVGNPGQYLSISSKATAEAEGDREEVLRHRGARRRRGQGVDRQPAASRSSRAPTASSPASDRTPTASSSSTTPRANAKVFAQSWDQALSPTAAETLLDNIAKLFQLSISPQQFADNMNEVIGQVTALAPPAAPATAAPRRRGPGGAVRSPGWRCRPWSSSSRSASSRCSACWCSASPSGTASARSTPPGFDQLAAGAQRPRPAARALGDLRGDGRCPGWCRRRSSLLLGVFLAGQQRYRGVPRGALLHPAAAQLGRDRDHLQGAARPELRPRRRAAHRAS